MKLKKIRICFSLTASIVVQSNLAFRHNTMTMPYLFQFIMRLCKWLPYYWPFVWGIQWSPGTMGDSRCLDAHVMSLQCYCHTCLVHKVGIMVIFYIKNDHDANFMYQASMNSYTISKTASLYWDSPLVTDIMIFYTRSCLIVGATECRPTYLEWLPLCDIGLQYTVLTCVKDNSLLT